MTGAAVQRRSRRQTSTPSRSGSPRSRRMTSGSRSFATCRAGGAGAGGLDPVALGGEARGQRAEKRGFVLDDEDRRLRAAGRVKVKRAPPPGVSPSAMVPPWASTIALHVARPMPVELAAARAADRTARRP